MTCSCLIQRIKYCCGCIAQNRRPRSISVVEPWITEVTEQAVLEPGNCCNLAKLLRKAGTSNDCDSSIIGGNAANVVQMTRGATDVKEPPVARINAAVLVPKVHPRAQFQHHLPAAKEDQQIQLQAHLPIANEDHQVQVQILPRLAVHDSMHVELNFQQEIDNQYSGTYLFDSSTRYPLLTTETDTTVECRLSFHHDCDSAW